MSDAAEELAGGGVEQAGASDRDHRSATSNGPPMAELRRAVGALLAGHPEAGPVVVGHGRLRLHLGSGERLDLTRFWSTIAADDPNTRVRLLSEHLISARQAAREASVSLPGDWSEARQRLGVVLRPWRPDRIGLALDRRVLAQVVLEAEHGMVAVDPNLMRRWGQRPATVMEAAISNSAGANVVTSPIPVPRLAARGHRWPRQWALSAIAGGPFTAGRLVAAERSMGPLEPVGLLAVALSDHVLVVARSQTGSSVHEDGEDARERVVGVLLDLAATTTSALAGAPSTAGVPVLHCRPGGRLGIFDAGPDRHDNDPEPAGRHARPHRELRR